MKIVAIGSHYDDIEIGCAGTLSKHINKGDDVKFIIIKKDEHLTGDPNNRATEQLNVLKQMTTIETRMKVHLKTFNSNDNAEGIINYIDSDSPDILFVPWEFDTHQDHRRASVIGQAAGRKRNTSTFFYSSGSTYDFNPNVFNKIDFSKKKEILQLFKSQIECGAINVDIIDKREAFWGSIISTDNIHAEGFIARKVRYPYGD